MVTRSASHALRGLEPAGRRLLLAAARPPYGPTAFQATLGRWTRSAAGRAATLFAVIAAAYVAGAELAWHHFSSGLAFGYPPSGVDVAALLLIARRRWPVVIAAIVVCEVSVDLQHHLTLAVALASALANAVEPVTGASFVRWFCRGRPDLGTRLGLALFVLGAAVLGPVAGGLIGASVSWASNGGWWPGLVLQWWAGDGIAVLVVGGTVLLWAQRRALVSSRWLELVLVVLLAAGLSVVAFRFGELASLPFLPILAWAAFRLRDLGVVLVGAAFAAVANYMTAAGYGEFAHLGLPSPASVAVTQAYIALVVLVGWVLAQEVAGRMSAVQDRDGARLERAMAEARREAAELGVALADATTVNSVADRVSAAVRARLDAAHVVISVLDDDGHRFEPLAGGDAAAQPAVVSAEWTVDSDAPGPRAVRERTAVYLSDLKAPDASIGPMAALPLLTEVGALGYLGVWWAGPREATGVEREYLRSMAETTSRALERARLREAERREHALVETLADLTRLLAAALTPEAIGEVVADCLCAVAGGADALCLGVISQDGRRLAWITTADETGEVREQFPDLPMEVPAAATDAARTGNPVIIRTPAEYEQRYPGRETPAVLAHGSSWLTWPLRAGTVPVGAIGLMWRHPQQFEPGQLAFVAAAADLVAQALVRARVYADEHAIAAVLQRAIVPATAAVIPGLEIGASYRQAGTTQQIGGDWYDAMALPGKRAYLAVGDVVGHGLTAAEDMTQLRNAGRTLAIVGYQPASILEELARVTDWATSGKFATAAAAIIEPDVSLVTYATAGHPPILVRRAKTGMVEMPPPAGGPALCLPSRQDSSRYTQGQTSFDVGDIMLMYTDGLIERRGEDLEDGIARVAERLQTWQPGAPLGSLCDELIASLAAEPQLDDMCVLAVRRPRPDRAQADVLPEPRSGRLRQARLSGPVRARLALVPRRGNLSGVTQPSGPQATPDLAGVRVLVTGGTSGLGFAMSQALAEAGARVVLTGRTEQRVGDAAARIAAGGRVAGLVMDARDEQSVSRGVDRALADLGGIDVLVNNAGIGMRTVNPRFMTDPMGFWQVSPDGFRDLLATNVLGYFLVARAVVPHMLQAGRGKIINISVNESTMRRRGFTPYGPSRAATDALSHIMAADLAGAGIDVNLLLPGGATRTGMTPDSAPEDMQATWLDPAIMGPPVCWLASRASDGVTDQRIVATEFAGHGPA